MLARAVNAGAMLIVLPLTVKTLGDERYGLWATFSVTLSWLALLDLGLGPSLRNALGESFGKDEKEGARDLVSSAFVFLWGIAGILAIAWALAFPWIPWRWLFNAHPSVSDTELHGAVAVVLATVILRLPLSVVGAVYAGYQRGDRAAIWDAVAALSSVIAVACAAALHADLAGLAIALSFPALLVLVLNAYVLFTRERPELRPSISRASLLTLRGTFRQGRHFLLIQVAVIVIFQSDNLIITRILGPVAVTEYSLAFRLFWMGTVLQGLVLNPFWSAYTEAFARHDLTWIRRQLRKTIQVSLLLTLPVAVLMTLAGPQVIHLWAHPQHLPSRHLTAALSVWMLLFVWQNCFAMLLNAIGSTALMSRLVLLSVPLNLILCIELGRQMGLLGIALANMATLLIGAIQAPWEAAVRLRQAALAQHASPDSGIAPPA
jgi:O-antigen/teichoic acid export membrane protein